MTDQDKSIRHLSCFERFTNRVSIPVFYVIIAFCIVLDALDMGVGHYYYNGLKKLCDYIFPITRYASVLFSAPLNTYLYAQYPEFASEPAPSILLFKVKILGAVLGAAFSVINSLIFPLKFIGAYQKFKDALFAKDGLSKQVKLYIIDSTFMLGMVFASLVRLTFLQTPSTYQIILSFKIYEDGAAVIIYAALIIVVIRAIWFVRALTDRVMERQP